jgi:hypothetical protein
MDMYLLKPHATALALYDASLVLGKEPCVIKLSFEQAMSFDEKFDSPEEMISFYGKENLLELGEFYEGYVAVYYSSWRQMVISFKGSLQRVSNLNDCYWLPQNMIEAAKNGSYYSVTYSNGACGAFQYVWTFNGCNFASWARMLKKKGFLPAEVSADTISDSLKKKIIAALVNNEAFSLSENEGLVLKTYLGNYYETFFSQL